MLLFYHEMMVTVIDKPLVIFSMFVLQFSGLRPAVL